MSKKVNKIISFTVTIAMIILTFFFFNATKDSGVSDLVMPLDNDWTLVVNGETKHVPKIAGHILPKTVDKDEVVVLERKLPSNTFPRSVMRFKVYHSVVKVFEDEELIYAYGDKLYESNRIVGSGLHYVYLGPNSAGKRVRISIQATEDGAFSNFSPIDILPSSYANTDFFASHALALFVGIFLILFGLLSVVICAVVSFFSTGYFRFQMIGLLSLSLGTWTLCYTKLIQVFSFNFSFNTTIEYFSLYMSPIPLGFLLMDMRRGQIKTWRWWGLVTLVAFGACYALVTSILHFTNVLHFPQTLLPFHIYVGVAFLYMAFSGVVYSKKTDLSGKFLTWGVLSFGVVAFADLIRYNVFKYLAIESFRWDVTWIPLGTLSFVMLLVLSYLVYLYKLVADRTEKEVLAAMVYIDSLTGLYNRAKCQQIFDVLDRSDGDFAIVSIDMNGLKYVNDKYGHSTGDRLIKVFANILRGSFEGVGATIRMGGDEFVAIVREEHLEDINFAINSMKDKMLVGKSGLPVPLEAAYGVAYRSECGPMSASGVYSAADKKMYAMKVGMKSDLIRR